MPEKNDHLADLERDVRELRLPVLELADYLSWDSDLPTDVEEAVENFLRSYRSLSIAIKRAR